MKQIESDYVSWRRVESLTDLLVKKLNRMHVEFQNISTITRGGLIPARLLADRLGINEILVDKNKIPSDSLFVDDIFDSGSTFKKIIVKAENPQKLVYLTLFARKGKRFPKQLVYAALTKGTEYVIFPWDKLEHQRLKKFQ